MKRQIKNFLTIGLTMVVLLFGLTMVVRAANLQDAFGGQLSTVGSKAGFDTSKTSVDPIIGTVISIALSFVGVIFLILMIYGGYMWMTAAGNEERAKKARQLIQAAILGLIVVIGAYAITRFVMGRIGSGLLSDGTGSSNVGSSNTGGSYTGTGNSGSGTGNGGTVKGGCCVKYSTVNPVVNEIPDCSDEANSNNCQVPPLTRAHYVSGSLCKDVSECHEDGCCVRKYDNSPTTCDMVDGNDFCGKIGQSSWAPVFDRGTDCSKISDCPQYKP